MRGNLQSLIELCKRQIVFAFFRIHNPPIIVPLCREHITLRNFLCDTSWIGILFMKCAAKRCRLSRFPASCHSFSLSESITCVHRNKRSYHNYDSNNADYKLFLDFCSLSSRFPIFRAALLVVFFDASLSEKMMEYIWVFIIALSRQFSYFNRSMTGFIFFVNAARMKILKAQFFHFAYAGSI